MADQWALRAACRGEDTELFFPTKGQSPDEALAICARCSVERECLEDAVKVEATRAGEPHGVAGGLTAKDRKPLVQQAKKAAGRRESAKLQRIRRLASAGMRVKDVARELDMDPEAVGAQLRRAAKRDRQVAA